ncbi:hypothetical protein L218DRAFT_1082234 [Marasmius fiardii PR-910]|nr:hypothetical protein L218DRAFT_1082234 [Marasmius fiardii PR-910]
MDLIFSKDSPRNATLALPNGQPVYELSTANQLFHTEQTMIKKYQSGSPVPQDMGLVEIHRFHKSVVEVWGRNVLPKRDGIFNRGQSFTSSNGQQYTWKRKSDAALLTDKAGHNMAIYREHHTNLFKSKKSTPATLSIAPEAMGLVDEIVGTFAYFEQEIRRARRNNGSAAAAGTSGDAGTMGGASC